MLHLDIKKNMFSITVLLLLCCKSPSWVTAEDVPLFNDEFLYEDIPETPVTANVNFLEAADSSSCQSYLSSFDQCVADNNQGDGTYRVDKLIPVQNDFENELKQCLISSGCSKTNVIQKLRSYNIDLKSEETFMLTHSNTVFQIGNLENQSRKCGIEWLEGNVLQEIESCTARKLDLMDWKFGHFSLTGVPGDPALAHPAQTARRHLNTMIEKALEVHKITADPELCPTLHSQIKSKGCIESLIESTEEHYGRYHLLKHYSNLRNQLCQAKRSCETARNISATCMEKRTRLREMVMECVWERLNLDRSQHISHYLQCVRTASGLPLHSTSRLQSLEHGMTVSELIETELMHKLFDVLPSKLAEVKKHSAHLCDLENTAGFDSVAEEERFFALKIDFNDGTKGLILLPNTHDGTRNPLPSETEYVSLFDSVFMDADFLQPEPQTKTKVNPQCPSQINALKGVLKWLQDFCAKGGDPNMYGFNAGHLEGLHNDCVCKNVSSSVSDVSYIQEFNVFDWIAQRHKSEVSIVPKMDEAGNNALVEFLAEGLLTPIKSLLSSIPNNDRLSYWGTM